MRLPDLPDTLDLSLGKTAPPDDGRHEPLLAYPEPGGEFDEVMRLDPNRRDREAKPPPVRGRWPRGPFDSLILHLLALVMIIGWPSPTPADIPVPIPVALVIEQPPPPKSAEPKPPASPVPGRRASDDFAETVAPKPEKGTAVAAAPSAGEPPPPAAATESATTTPLTAPPEPAQPKEEASAEPQPTTAETQLAALPPPPKPAAAKPPAPKTLAAARLPRPLGSEWPLPLSTDRPQAPISAARLVGPAAARDEYCANALRLTLRNIGMLPLAALGARHGETAVTFRVLGDGTLNSVKVAQSSGYPDIDERIARMVIAVGQFPPLPKWIPGQWMDFTFTLHFPHPLQR